MTRTPQTPGKRTQEMTFIALFVVLLVICSWISIPTSVPFTLQTFAVSTALLLLGGRRGTVTILVYLLLAAAGVPVLSGFAGGIGRLLGPTGGYVLGFLLTGLIYWGVTAVFGESLPARIAGTAAGLAVLYVFGTLWFVKVYTAGGEGVSLGAALLLCVVPFLAPEAVKQILAFTLCAKLRPHLRLED